MASNRVLIERNERKLICLFSGFSRVRLLKVDVPLETPEDAKILEVRHQVTIPSDNTTYWCSIHKLPDVFAKKHHVIQVSFFRHKSTVASLRKYLTVLVNCYLTETLSSLI